MEHVVETFSLTKIFSDWWGRNKIYAVDDLNLQVRNNEIFGLLGPNGSGKTTALKLLLGLLYPTKGRAVVLGGDATDPKISARVGFMPEESYLYRYLSARETLDFYGRLFGLPAKVREMRIEALLDMVGLKAAANRAIGTFSKGMARRIGLAQALINDPDLLILDEPTTGLDPIGTRQIKDLIIELAKRGKTVLLCSHLLADVEDVCDRIAILYGGKIQSEGSVHDLLTQTHKKQITTGPISDTAVEKIRRIVQQEQTDCEITSPMDKLETFFIRAVTAAQQQAQPTSGAVSTTQIGDFLISRPGILDKLVSPTGVLRAASVSTEPSPEPASTKRVKPAEIPETKSDEQLLRKLTEKTEPAQPKPIVKPEPAEPETDQKSTGRLTAQQNKKNILDQLTDSSAPKDEDAEQPDKSPEGDTSDA